MAKIRYLRTIDAGKKYPNAPTNLTATALSSSSISLTWTAVPTAIGYTVRRFGVTIATGVSSTSYVDSGLPASTLETYTVSAVNSYGEGPQSASASATTLGSGTHINPIGALLSAGGSGSSSYENFPWFKNRVRQGRGFTTGLNYTQTTYTAAGWPAQDFYCVLWEGQSTPSWLTAGAFTCGFIGTGTETITGYGGTISSIVPGTGGSYTTFKLTSTSGSLSFSVTGTTGGCTNVFAYLPAYPGTTVDNPTSAAAFTNEAVTFYGTLNHIQLEWPSIPSWNTRMMTSTNRHQYVNPWISATTNAQTQVGGQVTNGTFTSAPTGTSGTLVSWVWGPGNWLFFLSTAQSIEVTVGSGTSNVPVTWTAALTGSPSATFSYGTEGLPIEWMLALAIAANTGVLINMPIYEDGTSGAAGSYTTAIMQMVSAAITANPGWTGNIIFEPLGNEPWNSIYYTYRFIYQNYPSGPYGYPDVYSYIAYRMHAFAQIGVTTFGSLWGNRVTSMLGWQIGSVSGFYEILNDMVTAGYTPSADMAYGAVAPYMNPTVTTAMTVAQLESAVSTDASTRMFVDRTENTAIMLMHYGLKLMAYEANTQWNAISPTPTNLAAALADSGMIAPIKSYVGNMLNSGYQLISWSTEGLTAVAPPASGAGNEFGAGAAYATFFSSPPPVLQALQSFFSTAPTLTRNVINGAGSVLLGGNYADQVGAANPAFPAGLSTQTNGSPYYSAQGYIGWFFNCTVAGTYTVVVTCAGTGTPSTNVEIGSLSGFTIPITGASLGSGANTVGNVTLGTGPGYILLGNGSVQSTLTITQIAFNSSVSTTIPNITSLSAAYPSANPTAFTAQNVLAMAANTKFLDAVTGTTIWKITANGTPAADQFCPWYSNLGLSVSQPWGAHLDQYHIAFISATSGAGYVCDFGPSWSSNPVGAYNFRTLPAILGSYSGTSSPFSRMAGNPHIMYSLTSSGVLRLYNCAGVNGTGAGPNPTTGAGYVDSSAASLGYAASWPSTGRPWNTGINQWLMINAQETWASANNSNGSKTTVYTLNLSNGTAAAINDSAFGGSLDDTYMGYGQPTTANNFSGDVPANLAYTYNLDTSTYTVANPPLTTSNWVGYNGFSHQASLNGYYTALETNKGGGTMQILKLRGDSTNNANSDILWPKYWGQYHMCGHWWTQGSGTNQFMLISMDWNSSGSSSLPGGWASSENYAISYVNPDTGNTYRLCFHYSVCGQSSGNMAAGSGIGFTGSPGGASQYYSQAHASVSHDGKLVIFGSNMGNQARIDLFVAEVPLIAGSPGSFP